MTTKQPTGLGRGLGELFQRTTPDAAHDRHPSPVPPGTPTADPADLATATGSDASAPATTAPHSAARHGTPGTTSPLTSSHPSGSTPASAAASTASGEAPPAHPGLPSAVSNAGLYQPISPTSWSDSPAPTDPATAPLPPSPSLAPATPPATSPTAALSSTIPITTAYLTALPLESIDPNPDQPRTVFDPDDLQELADSIDEVGLLQPIVVRPLDNNRFELVMGERRWRAAQLAGLDPIPSIVRPTEEADRLRDALLENIHRVQLNPLEEAAAYQQLLTDFACTQDELATRVKKSRPQISNTLRLLKLPPAIQRRLAAGVLSAGHARALLSLDDAQAMERLAQRIVAEGLSVRATEELTTLSETRPSHPRAARPRAANPRALELAQALSDQFDTRVRVDIGAAKGRITIEFAGDDDLARILTLLQR